MAHAMRVWDVWGLLTHAPFPPRDPRHCTDNMDWSSWHRAFCNGSHQMTMTQNEPGERNRLFAKIVLHVLMIFVNIPNLCPFNLMVQPPTSFVCQTYGALPPTSCTSKYTPSSLTCFFFNFLLANSDVVSTKRYETGRSEPVEPCSAIKYST